MFNRVPGFSITRPGLIPADEPLFLILLHVWLANLVFKRDLQLYKVL